MAMAELYVRPSVRRHCNFIEADVVLSKPNDVRGRLVGIVHTVVCRRQTFLTRDHQFPPMGIQLSSALATASLLVGCGKVSKTSVGVYRMSVLIVEAYWMTHHQ